MWPDQNFNRYRYQYFISETKFFDSDTKTAKKIAKVFRPGSLKTETSHSAWVKFTFTPPHSLILIGIEIPDEKRSPGHFSVLQSIFSCRPGQAAPPFAGSWTTFLDLVLVPVLILVPPLQVPLQALQAVHSPTSQSTEDYYLRTGAKQTEKKVSFRLTYT